MPNEFFVRCDCRFRRNSGVISRNLQEVDDSKGIAIVLAVFVRCCPKPYLLEGNMIIRHANMNDLDALIKIEQSAFPPTEAASRDGYAYRIEHFSSWFLLAEDADGIKGLACSRPVNTEEMNDDMYEAEPMEEGNIISLLSIATDPKYQRRGIAGELLEAMKKQAKEEKRSAIILACKAAKVHYYAKFGFVEVGPSKSEHGGVPWIDMIYRLS